MSNQAISQAKTPDVGFDQFKGEVQVTSTFVADLKSSETLKGAEIDRDIQINLEQLGANSQEARMSAMLYLKHRSSEPAVAYKLAELLMASRSQDSDKSGGSFVHSDINRDMRDLAELALAGSNAKEGRALLDADRMIRRLEEGCYKFGTKPVNLNELLANLKEVCEHPLVEERLLRTLTSDSPAGYYAATILQGTSNKALLDKIGSHLKMRLDPSSPGADRDYEGKYLPTALKYSSDPDAQKLVVRSYSAPDTRGDIRVSAADAMGGINTEESRKLLFKGFFEPRVQNELRNAVASAIRELGGNEIQDNLVPLIESSRFQAVAIVANQRSSGIFGKCVSWCQLMLSKEIFDIRVQAGLALLDHRPDLAKKVFEEATRVENTKGLDATRYHSSMVEFAERALRRLQANS